MYILWLSEIKWSYLRTRKQQILSRFPEDDMILFVEPIAKRASNRITFTHEPPVHAVTIPHIRAVTNPIVNSLLNKTVVRVSIHKIAGAWLDIVLRSVGWKPDVLVTSNVFWSPNITRLKKRWPELPVVYECNDNPLGFPRTPPYKETYVHETLRVADLITTPHIACIPGDPDPYADKITIISNGVDLTHFTTEPDKKPLVSISRPVIMYVGAISEWFDFDLMERLAEEQRSASIVLIGPIADTVRVETERLLEQPNIMYIPPVPYVEIRNYLAAADVCIIPFVTNELTRPVVPNKLFEYMAVGKTTVAGPFNPDLKEFDRWVYVSDSGNDFIRLVGEALKSPLPRGELQAMAAHFDWNAISRTFRGHLVDLVKG